MKWFLLAVVMVTLVMLVPAFIGYIGLTNTPRGLASNKGKVAKRSSGFGVKDPFD